MVWFKDGPSPGEEGFTYEDYLRLPALLELQAPKSDPPEHDELQFIVVHQTYELWFKLILHELDEVAARIGRDDARGAARLLRRAGEIMRVLVAQIHVLETMLPADFLRFRDRLKPASGFQSAQFREVEFLLGLKDRALLRFFAPETDARARLERRLAAPSLGEAFFALLARRGLGEARLEALRAIYREGATEADLLELAEALIDLDEQVTLWRFHHVRMAERVIGAKPGTGGSEGVHYLAGTLAAKPHAFPELWEVRTLL
jgi:tryptophan 2,3-dioxygenase